MDTIAEREATDPKEETFQDWLTNGVIGGLEGLQKQ